MEARRAKGPVMILDSKIAAPLADPVQALVVAVVPPVAEHALVCDLAVVGPGEGELAPEPGESHIGIVDGEGSAGSHRIADLAERAFRRSRTARSPAASLICRCVQCGAGSCSRWNGRRRRN